MRRWLFSFFLALLFPSLLPAQCEFLPTLQRDSSLVLVASDGAIVGNSSWFKSPTVLNTFTWLGNSLEDPVDTTFIASNTAGIARYEYFIPPELLASGAPQSLLFSILSEPVSVDSIRDIWVNFSREVEVWADLPGSGLQQIGGGEISNNWIPLVSINSPNLSEEVKGWELKYKNASGILGDVLIIPQESGVVSLQVHGDQPGYRYSQLMLSPTTVQQDSSFQYALEYPSTRPLPVSVDSIDLLVDGNLVGDQLIQICGTDSFLVSTNAEIGAGVNINWFFNDEPIGNNPQIQIGPELSAGLKEVVLELDGPDVCASGNIQLDVGEVGGTFQAEILSPLDGSIFCDTDVFLDAIAPGEGVEARWYESSSSPSLVFNSESDSSTIAVANQLGPYEVVWEISQNGCVDRDTVSIFFLESIPLELGEDLVICEGESVLIGAPATPGLEYNWIPRDFLEDPQASQTVATPIATTVYLLEAVDPIEDCLANDIITVEVLPGAEFVGANFRIGVQESQFGCGSADVQEIESGTPFTLEFLPREAGPIINWYVDSLATQGVFVPNTQRNGNGIISQSLTLLPNTERGLITYKGVYQDPGCEDLDTCSFSLQVIPGEGPVLIPQAITPNGDAINDVWTLLNMNANAQYRVQVFNRSGALVFEAENYASTNNWNAERLPDGSYWYRVEEIDVSGTQTYTGGLFIQRNPR